MRENSSAVPGRANSSAAKRIPACRPFGRDCCEDLRASSRWRFFLVGIVACGGDTNFFQRLVATQHAIFQNSFELIVHTGGSGAIDFEGDELLALLQQDEASSARVLARVGDRLLVDVVPLA